MNREIKFRARNAGVPKCWIYGYFVKEWGCNYIINNDGKFKVIAGTECQYTGLKDKQGVEIYEGDRIIHASRNGGNPHPVIYYPDLAAWCGEYGLKYPLQACELEEVEVIGNIYEDML